MTIIDANLLLYAYNADSPQQASAADWLERLLESQEVVALPSATVWAFIRLCTNARIWPNPRSPQEAFAIINDWLSQPNVILLQPGQRHMELLQKLVVEHNAVGPLLTDAVMAALAIENGALLASTDQEFGRFSQLRWVNPLSAQ